MNRQDLNANEESPLMNRLTLAASILLLAIGAAAHGQCVARVNHTLYISTTSDGSRDAIEQLKRLQENVIVYRSLGEFEESGKLARVPRETFERELREVTIKMQEIFSRMPAGKIKDQLTNSLASYRDGAYWWHKIDQPRVMNVAALAYEQREFTPADDAFTLTIPYTVAINWRQASHYLTEAERAINGADSR